MAVASILRVLLVAGISRCSCESSGGYHYNKPTKQFGEILKPPPLPISSLYPVPFHGGVPRPQRQNAVTDNGYHYPPPPPPPPPALTTDFKFPAPFYKQYNFNFVPPPQPFTTTPSSSLFQKVSSWLFSQQSSYEPPVYSSNSIAPLKKDCNPCNLSPWIPVIRYDVGAKKLQQNLIPTYGPPSPTADFQNVAQYHPQPFQSSPQKQNIPQLYPAAPHAVYGPPSQSFSTPGSTYGPPSPTHTLPTQNPLSSPYSVETSSYTIPSSSYGVPSSSISVPNTSYDTPSTSYGEPTSSYKVPNSNYRVPSSTFATPSPPASSHVSSTSGFVPMFNNELLNYDNGLKELEPASELQLPKVTNPSGFKNSYGEPITNTYALDIPYPVSATAAESTKVKTEVLPDDNRNSPTNMTLALASPAPFTLNRGRNIHTLQPVALPNLSVSPLPPIFNARPFRPISSFNANILKGINHLQQNTKNVNIEQSLPVAEFTHSIDYPPTVIKSHVIDLDASRNQSKAYRNIPNGFNFDDIRDVSYQASEDHVAATKSNPDISFESTGLDFGNDLYDSNIPTDFKKISNNLANHKNEFADLRGAKDEDVDKYRTESNLQNIDSPLLYLKPSAPHKDHENFVIAVSTSAVNNDYEIYDDIPTTVAPLLPTPVTSWDESRTNYGQGLVPPSESQNDKNKPKIVQIIVPYTTNKQNSQSNSEYHQIAESWTSTPEDEYQARKVPQNTENNFINSVTDSYTTLIPTTEKPDNERPENFDSEKLSAHAILNDLYDVKEPPFDIIKLQHTIDDWTAQEYSKHHKMPQKTRTNTKYAKQIPDEYFTTVNPITNYATVTNYYNYDMYDHEGQSSMLYSITEDKNRTDSKPLKEYNKIERTKTKHTSAKNEDDDKKKPHIYTAASSFRSSTTTSAPWGKIQTSISPLTKEKVYVVTSKPWREALQTTEKPNDLYDADAFESKKTSGENDATASGTDDLGFKSPRFSSRPSFGFSGSGSANVAPLKTDSNYGFSKSWHQSINDLESKTSNNTTPYEEGSRQSSTNSNAEDDLFYVEEYTTTRTAELPNDDVDT